MKSSEKTPQTKSPVDPKLLLRAIHYSTAIYLVGHRVKAIREMNEKASFLWNDFLPSGQFKEEIKKIMGFAQKEIETAYSFVLKAFEKVEFQYEILDLNHPCYPKLLKDVSSPPPFLFVRGDISLFQLPVVSIVGTRTPSPAGVQRATKLSVLLSEKGIAIASGLAKGIDQSAHVGALHVGGRTIAVLGTPLDVYYPRENANLQEVIGQTNLLVSQFPFSHPVRPYTFPIRNYTMSGISLATVVVEAKQGSGALYQAQDALRQGRLLFIMKHLLTEPGLEWPQKFLGKTGVHVLSNVEDLLRPIGEKKDVLPEPIQTILGFKDFKTIKVGL